MNERERIEMLLKCYNLTPSQFADKSGIQRASVSHILSGRNKLSLDVVLKIHEAFPAVDLEWIMTGTGDAPTVQQNDVSKPEEATLFTPSAEKVNEYDEVRIQPEKQYAQNRQQQVAKQQQPRTQRKPTTSRIAQSSIDTGRHIKEVRIFYTDGTYETLVPEK